MVALMERKWVVLMVGNLAAKKAELLAVLMVALFGVKRVVR